PAAARGRPAHRRGDRGRPAGGRRGPRRSATRAGGGPALAEVPDRGGAEARGTRSGGGTGPGGTHPHPRRLTEMMLMSTSRRGLTQRLTDFGSLSGFVGLGREVLAHSL